MSYLDKIQALHPNALVAWDRDVKDPPNGNWELTPWKHQKWSSPKFGGLRFNGLGVIIIWEGSRFTSHFWRAVLHTCDKDPLGIKWHVD